MYRKNVIFDLGGGYKTLFSLFKIGGIARQYRPPDPVRFPRSQGKLATYPA